MKNVTSIRFLESLKMESLLRHHRLVAEIDKKIVEIRKARGTKLVDRSGGKLHEVGRDREPTHG